MPTEVFLLVLCAALVHAIWNAMVKSDGDRLGLMKVMSLTQLVLSAALMPFVAVPAVDSWPCLAASPILTTGYVLFLSYAYRAGDLSHVYPLARGIAPLIVAIVSIGFLGERLAPISQLAILLIAAGITSLMLTRGAAGLRDPRPTLFALATGGFIASYTLVDGIGARASGTASGYMVWISLLSSLAILAAVHWMQRGQLQPLSPRTRRAGFAVGLLSYGATWVVIWAMTQAPIALVSALRETGVVFAVIIGVVVLKERLNLARLASIATTLTGTALLKFSR